MNERDFRFDSTCKMKTSSHLGSIKDRIGIECRDKAKDISEQLPVTPSVIPAEMARVQVNFKFDLVLQGMKHCTVFFLWLLTAVCYVLGSVGLNHCRLKAQYKIYR